MIAARRGLIPRAGMIVVAMTLIALGGCHRADPDAGRPAAARGFPRGDRAPHSGRWPSAEAPVSEAARESGGEAQTVMDMAGVAPGMTVADIGAGQGYYTVRLAPRVGAKGRVLAEDIDSTALSQLGDRVQRERLDNVSITLGDAADPHMPAASFDRVFLINVYRYVSEPYAFLWHLRPALRPGGRVIVVEADAPTTQGGMPPALLFCEFSVSGFRLSEFIRKPGVRGYFAAFEPVGSRPQPADIIACRDPARDAGGGAGASA